MNTPPGLNSSHFLFHRALRFTRALEEDIPDEVEQGRRNRQRAFSLGHKRKLQDVLHEVEQGRRKVTCALAEVGIRGSPANHAHVSESLEEFDMMRCDIFSRQRAIKDYFYVNQPNATQRRKLLIPPSHQPTPTLINPYPQANQAPNNTSIAAGHSDPSCTDPHASAASQSPWPSG